MEAVLHLLYLASNVSECDGVEVLLLEVARVWKQGCRGEWGDLVQEDMMSILPLF